MKETRVHTDNDVQGQFCVVWMLTLSSLPSLYPVRASAESILITDMLVLVDGVGA